MPPALVTTKLFAPRTRPNLVARPRLREALSRAEGRPLTLVSAPAGFGKTTLLGEWSRDLTAKGASVAWVSLDRSDNDPARFLSYLIGALREAEEGIGESALAALDSPQPPPMGVVMEILVNDLAGAAREVTVIFDDYHLIDSGPIHEAMAHFLERLPENAHLVISGRTDPPLPLPKLRARDQVTELRAADLRFTPEEAAAFLNGAMGLDLSPEDLGALGGITEGWVAALQLAAISMRGRGDASAFVGAFSGSNRHVIDFLAEEVLERQAENVREFLLETSVLGRMSAPLCDAVTGRDDGQAMLERLERGNLFVVALDDGRRWYRYHHLFAGFLRGRLLNESPELMGESHLRASAWYEDNGLVAEAVEHALSAPDHERAARLIEGGVKGAWSRGEAPTVLRWVDALSDDAKHRRPRLILEHAQALVLIGRPDEAEPLLEEVEKAIQDAEMERPFLAGYAWSIRAWDARLRGQAPRAAEFARRALSLLPEEEMHLRNFAAVCLGDALRTTGDLAAAGEAFAEATRLGRSAGHVYGTLTAMVWHGRILAARGRLREAEDLFGRALRFVTEKGLGTLPASGLARIGMGSLLYERNDLEEAERELVEGTDLVERTGEVSNLVWGYVTLSRTKLARGDGEGALEKAYEADRVARASGADLEISIATAWMTRLRLSRGDLAEAVALERERAANAENSAEAARVVDSLASARVLHARGRHGAALEPLEKLRGYAQTSGITGGLIEILALQALVLWADNQKERALSNMRRALTLAEREGFVRTIVDEGPAMTDLLSAILETRRSGRLEATDGTSARYLAKLLDILSQEAEAPGANERLPEPLSERELEVLALVAAGGSNREIAGRLFVSTSTVKTHVNNLYRKLDVGSRTRAVARARELGLI